MDKLALHGGKPVRKTMLHYGQQWLDEEDMKAVMKVMQGDFLTQGPSITEFETLVAKQAGTEYAVAFCNGTAALHGACFAAGIGPGDEVVTTPLTFAASANCILYQGGTPVFADVDEDTYLIDLEQVKLRLSERTKAIIPVDFTGQPIDMARFYAFAREHNLVMIQDAAHSLGASFDGIPAGSIADMTMFSFHPVKPVTTGEGGMIVTNRSDYYERLLLFRSHGITRDPNVMDLKNEGPWYHEMQELGYNYRITDIQATLGASQMHRLQSFLNMRREIAEQYNHAFADLEQAGIIRLPSLDDRALSGWHLYILQLQLEHLNVGRKEIFEALRAENIGVNVHYLPVYNHPYYKRLGYAPGLCTIAERLYDSFITLPLFPKMSTQDIQDVIQAVRKIFHYYSKSI
jgi:perosamine synthetase